jgi:hypothetical protein
MEGETISCENENISHFCAMSAVHHFSFLIEPQPPPRKWCATIYGHVLEAYGVPKLFLHFVESSTLLLILIGRLGKFW